MNNKIFVGPPGSGKTYRAKYEVIKAIWSKMPAAPRAGGGAGRNAGQRVCCIAAVRDILKRTGTDDKSVPVFLHGLGGIRFLLGTFSATRQEYCYKFLLHEIESVR